MANEKKSGRYEWETENKVIYVDPVMRLIDLVEGAGQVDNIKEAVKSYQEEFGFSDNEAAIMERLFMLKAS